MGKYKKGLVNEIEEKQIFAKEQKKLKAKHHISEDEDKIIVETSNMIKFFIRTGAGIIRVAVNIIIGILALIGLAALVYPAPRMELWVVWNTIIEELLGFIR